MAVVVPEYTAVAEQIYIAYFGRPADRTGLINMTNLLATGQAPTAITDIAAAYYTNGAVKAIFDSFGSSTESTTLYTGTDAQFIVSIYHNVLGRDPLLTGLDFWTNALATKTMTRAEAAVQIMAAAQANPTDAATIANKTTVATNFTAAIDTASEDLAYNGKAAAQTVRDLLSTVNNTTDTTAFNANITATLAGLTNTAVVGQTYALTNGVDTLVGTAGNDTFNASVTSTSATLGGLDVVDGGAGNDILNIADTSVASGADFNLPAGFNVKNVENISIITNGALGTFGGTALDISNFTGLTAATLVAAGAGSATGSNIKAADTTDVTLTVAGTAKATIAGGHAVTVNAGSGTVGVTGAGLTAVTVKGGGVATIDNTTAGGTSAGGSTLTTVTLDGSTAATAALKGKGITTVNLNNIAQADAVTLTNTTAGHAVTVNVSNTGYDASGSAVVVSFADANATSATVNAVADSTLALSAALATTVKVGGAGNLVLDLTGNTAITSVDATANSGGVDLTGLVATAVSVKGGSGADTITTNQTTKVAFDLGAGNDIVTINSVIAAGSTINLGAGNDALLKIGGSVAASTSTDVTVIDGGAGFDTVSAALLNAGNAAQFKNFEAVDASATATLDLSLMTGSTITAVTLNGGTGGATISNVGSTVGLTVDGVNTGTTTLAVNGAVANAADVFNITFAGTAASSAPSSANIAAGTVALASIETINLISGGNANTWNSVTLQDDAAKSIVITGAKNLDVSIGQTVASNAVKLTSIDASAATGKVSITDTSNLHIASALTIKGGTAADTFTLGASGATVTGGAGADNFKVGAATSNVSAGVGATAAADLAGSLVKTVITDFTAGDTITFATSLTSNTFTTTKVDVSAATTLGAALDLAAAGSGATATSLTTWFVWGNDSYLVQDRTAGATLAATDIVVKIVGVTDLSHATIAADVLKMA